MFPILENVQTNFPALRMFEGFIYQIAIQRIKLVKRQMFGIWFQVNNDFSNQVFINLQLLYSYSVYSKVNSKK